MQLNFILRLLAPRERALNHVSLIISARDILKLLLLYLSTTIIIIMHYYYYNNNSYR